MIGRAAFLKGLIVATGGLDVWDTPPPIRVGAQNGRVDQLDLDSYLKGVLPLEVSPSWPEAALQAQAIVARTYALAKKNLGRGYDIGTTTADQRYGGSAARRPATDAAVDATSGLVLEFAGGPASVYYSACCGGHTEDAAEVWGHEALAYLRGVADPFCTDAPDFRWTRTLPADRARIALGLPAVPTAVTLGVPDPSGRPRTATIACDVAPPLTLPVTQLRDRWGPDVVRSTWLTAVGIDATQAAPFVRIEGSGRGHGVGLCQWGARGMALAGADVSAILDHFFPGTTVTGG